MTPILEVKNITKRYKNVLAVDGISFQIPQGICFGLWICKLRRLLVLESL